jgi:uncharacterized membrane protein YccC
MLSVRFKEAFKVALAMTIAYGIALSMDWDKPYWAGFAVAFVSLATIGQSLNKAGMRMLGTLLGVVVALVIIAISPQSRWLFMVLLSLWVALCTYMMGGTKRQYFWNVGGFVSVIVALDAGPDSANAFDIAILRAQETGLGILVYSLVAVLLWPNNSGKDFLAAVGSLASSQHQLFRAYLGLMGGQGDAEKARALRGQEVQVQARFNELLDAAETDAYEVWELRRQWRNYQHQSADLAETMERWRESFAEVKDLDLPQLLPGLEAFGDEIERRLAQVDRMIAGDAPQSAPQVLDLAFDRDAVNRLSHFHKAAIAVTRSRLQRLEVLTRSLFEAVGDIKGLEQAAGSARPAAALPSPFIPDPDRLSSAVRIMAIMWLAYLGLIFVPDLPGGAGVVMLSTSAGMVMASTPQLSVTLLFVPAAASVLFAGLIHIFVMPQLSSFAGLGPLIFATTFAICYLFVSPRHALGRALGLALFFTIASISNQQTYSFLSVANTALMFPLVFLILAIAAYFPFSTRPETVYLRLLGRFFRSAEYLMSTMNWGLGHTPSGIDRLRKAFHLRQLDIVPLKLGAWARYIDTKVLRNNSSEDVQALVTSLQALSYRMQNQLDARSYPQAEFLVQELFSDFKAWRLRVQGAFQGLSYDPVAGEAESAAFRNRLSEIMDHMEQRIEQTLDKTTEGQISVEDAVNFYRLMGAYRGVSEAMVDYVGAAGRVDWDRWREARF